MRIAVISDVHSNLHALDAVLAHVGSVDAIWHLGDIVGYGPEPDAVVDRLATAGAIGVRGNHDSAACGGNEIDWFNAEARAAMEWTRRVISPSTVAWLTALPARREEADFTLVHGSPLDPIWEYLTTTAAARDNIAAISTVHGLNGHTHVPMAFSLDGDRMGRIAPSEGRTIELELDGHRLLLNPGSVGQPRDGDPRASYLILDLAARHAQWGRVAYDIDAVRAQMRAAGLPFRLSERLRHGF
ncbi:MAG: metallophosphoesterase family protein [Candidatus Limnocylindrales bacterium]|nr:metallophosphoesterase family protein [Candidatus Limnocylindrales bacterium]